MANPISNDRTLPYDLEISDDSEPNRQHRAGEVMALLYKLLNQVVVYETPPVAADRWEGQIWVDTSVARTGAWMCDENKLFTIQLG